MRTLADHPRSRGVYAPPAFVGSAFGGSSPLARGLHGVLHHRVGPGRIIPARAGFTRTGWPAKSTGQDHPRSRGVYISAVPPGPISMGSSPLARGLRGDSQVCVLGAGIIPARAGFTRRRGTMGDRGSDHPRSRGVYHPRTLKRQIGAGSSPLARGLLRVHVRIDDGHRIIPARAGFTCTTGRLSARPWDHPRSRGVYPSSCGSRSLNRGSSPLARGLHRPPVRVRLPVGIIPARAGFTNP